MTDAKAHAAKVRGQLLNRRTVLRGAGALVALPALEAMLPEALAAGAKADSASAAPAAPRRMAFLYVPNGIHMPAWTPKTEGPNFDLPETLQPLAPHQKDLLVLSGLTCDKARANGDGAGDHARASGAFLTGCQPRKTAGANFKAGISADQVAAQQLGDRTRLPSLELGIESFRGSGNCDSGYSCVYQHTLAWRSPTSPLPTETSPRLIFDRLFAERTNDADRLKRNKLRASVLDAVLEDAKSLNQQLGGADKQKLDQYLSCVRELELRITRSEKLPPVKPPEGAERPAGSPADLTEHMRQVCDLLVLAFQADVTRVATFMLAREGSNTQYKMIGVSEGHHEISHHQNNAALQAKIQKINRFHIEQFAYLVQRMKSVKEGSGTLLDSCMLAYGSAIEDGNRHNHHNVPIVLAGQGGGTIQTGRHVRYSQDTPLNNLWLAMLERMGAATAQLGDSTGVLQGLS